jgi:O-antigen/teichoic acid export membrane protein
MNDFTSIGINALEGVKSRLRTHHHAIRSVAALSSGNIVSTALGIGGGLLVARFLGPEETGLFRSYTIPLMYLAFLHMGTFDGLTRQIPFYIGKDMPEKVEALASSAGAWNLLMSAIVAVGFGICAIYSAWHHDMAGVAGWLAQALCAWGVFYGGYVGATYRTLNHFVAVARIQLLQSIVTFGAVFLLPILKFYGLCVRSVVSSVFGVWLFHRNRPIRAQYRFSTPALKEVIKIGFPLTFWGSIWTSVWTASESALVLYLGGVSGLGLFAVAVVLRDGMSVLPLAVSQVLSPRVVETFARSGSIKKANAISMWITVGLTAFMVIAVLVASWLLDFLVPLAIPKYAEGISLMKICLWFAVVHTAALPLNTLFAKGRPWIWGRGVIPGLIVFPLSAYFLIPALGGACAVAAGSLVGRSVRLIAGYIDIALLTKDEAAQV